MQFNQLIVITGKSGVYQLEGVRSNGAFVRALKDDKREFVSSRQHMYTPLENITIYTTSEAKPLRSVFQIIDTLDAASIPDPKSDNSTLRSFFLTVLPDHDVEKVYASDIKKIITWFHILKANAVSFEQAVEQA